MIIESISNLPDKIQSAYQNKKQLNGRFLFSFKTLYKPNATIPIIWLTLLSDGFLFLNTHKTRGNFREISLSEINCIRLRDYSSSENLLEIVSNDIYTDDLVMEIPKEVDLADLKARLSSAGIEVM